MTNTQKMLKPNRRQKLQAGDYFAIPLKNGEYGLGQILDMVECVDNATCVLFNQKFVEGTPILASVGWVLAPTTSIYSHLANGGCKHPPYVYYVY